MAEALLNHLGGNTYKAFSAGSKPTGEVHPLALATLQLNGIPVQNPVSKSWDEFANASIDVVVTVCDSAAGESCPVDFGKHERLHWSTPDPAAVKGSEEEIQQAFDTAFASLRNRIEELVRNA